MDVEIRGVQAWPVPEITGVNRLFFREGSRLQTSGWNFRIQAKRILSDGGVIESWPDGQTAALNVVGRSGGKISIEADGGDGVLRVFARGENGGAGLTGSAGGRGAKGPRGYNAEVRSERDCWSLMDSRLTTLPRIMREGPGHCSTHYYCSRETGDGGRGGQGVQGGRGTNGQPGGDAAELQVLVHSDSSLQIVHESLPGRGGSGGAGGAGGPGGFGGDPGSRDSGERCRLAGFGPVGPPGLQGGSGDPGRSGSARPVCVSLGHSQVGDC